MFVCVCASQTYLLEKCKNDLALFHGDERCSQLWGTNQGNASLTFDSGGFKAVAPLLCRDEAKGNSRVNSIVVVHFKSDISLIIVYSCIIYDGHVDRVEHNRSFRRRKRQREMHLVGSRSHLP